MFVVLGILGVLSILYGICVMLVRSGTGFFAVWFANGILLLLCAWATRIRLWDRVPLAAKRLGAAAFALVLAGILATQLLVLSQFDAKGEPELDYLVMLGAQVRPDGTPSPVLQYRLDAACRYLEANPGTLCVVSGGQGPNEPTTEAEGMAAYLEQHGIARERILLESESRNTAENIANSAAIIGSAHARVGIVTNNFHVYRGVRLAHKAGLKGACGIAAYSSPLYLPNNMLRESIGIAKDFLTGKL